MSLHEQPQSPELVAALGRHGLATDTPSQLSDAFRLGWVTALAEAQAIQLLEWETDKPSQGSYAEKAHTPFGDFRIEHLQGGKGLLLTGPGLRFAWDDRDIDSAKRAVQETFESSVRWCLLHQVKQPTPSDTNDGDEILAPAPEMIS